MKRFKRAKRSLLAITLVLAFLLCACATRTPPEESSQIPTSLDNVTSGDAPSDESETAEESDVSEESSFPPEKPVSFPEEREAEIELIATFQTGNEGLFPIAFWGTGIYPPQTFCADQNGTVYLMNGGYVWRIPDGKEVCKRQNDLSYREQIQAKDGLLYVLYGDGFVIAFSPEDESIQYSYDLSECTNVPTMGKDIGRELIRTPSGQLLLWIFSKLGTRVYRLDGTQLTQEEQDAVLPVEEEGAVVYLGHRFPADLYEPEMERSPTVLGVRDGAICVSFSQTYAHTHPSEGTQFQHIYSFYDRQTGEIRSRAVINDQYDAEATPCDIPLGYSNISLAEICFRTVRIGDAVFPGVVDTNFTYGEDGRLYMVLYYERNAKVYRITPGFSTERLMTSCEECAKAKGETA